MKQRSSSKETFFFPPSLTKVLLTLAFWSQEKKKIIYIKKKKKKDTLNNTPHPPSLSQPQAEYPQGSCYCRGSHTAYLSALVNRGGGDVVTCERKQEGGGGGWCEHGSLDFFCVAEFPRRGKPWQGHSPAKEAGRKPQAGVRLPKKGLEDADARFTARTMTKGCTPKERRETCSVQRSGVSFLTGSSSPPCPPPACSAARMAGKQSSCVS